MQPKDRLLVALDVATMAEARALVGALHPVVGGFKVGLELCHSVGTPRVLDDVGAMGDYTLFLDLKLHDIPNTVARTVAVLARRERPIHLLTLHSSGGRTMLQAAANARKDYGPFPKLLAITLLTSIDDEILRHELGVERSVESHVVALAQLAQDSGIDGVIASPKEVCAIKAACGDSFLVVTPGVRPAWADTGDQQRWASPAAALEDGADYLVVGRPITAAPDAQGGPVAAAERIVNELTLSS